MAACTESARYLSLPKPPKSGHQASGTNNTQSDVTDCSGNSSDSSAIPHDAPKATVKRRRVCRRKVRTGCITCKSRHVKCDERKPSCAACERLSLTCAGYESPKVKKTVVRSERLLMPRPKEASLVSFQPEAEPAKSFALPYLGMLPEISPTNPLVDHHDHWYFSLFRDQVIHELSPYHGVRFWNQVLYRDSTVHQCIRHCVLSIGAYARAIMELRHEKPWEESASHPWRTPTPYSRHLRAALEHNTMALHSLRAHLDVHGIDNRLTMAATLLFIVFQNMQGNFHRSGDLIRAGIKIMKGMKPATTPSRMDSSPLRWQRSRIQQGADVCDMIDMADMFIRHSVSYVFVPFHHAKFAYHLLITEDTDDDESDCGEDDEEREKSGLRDAQHHPDGMMMEWPQSVAEAQMRWDYFFPVLASFQSKTAWHNLHPDMDTDKLATLDKQASLLAQLNNFGSALESLAVVARASDAFMTSPDSRTLELLQLQHMMALVFISCCTDPTELAYDSFLYEFETVLQRVDALAMFTPQHNSSTKVGFSNEVGVLQLVAFAGAKCRVPRIRQQAMALLKRHDWREGNWDGISLALGLEGIMRLEGQWSTLSTGHDHCSSTDFLSIPPLTPPYLATHSLSSSPTPELMSTTPVVPPPQSRYAWTNMFWDFDRRHLTFEYSRVTRDELGEFQKARWEMDESRMIDKWSYFSSVS